MGKYVKKVRRCDLLYIQRNPDFIFLNLLFSLIEHLISTTQVSSLSVAFLTFNIFLSFMSITTAPPNSVALVR
jgi:hypothetical protein